MINGNGNGIWDNKEMYHAAAGVAMIFAGASLLMANPDLRIYIKDTLKAAFPNLDLDKIEDPIGLGLAAFMPDIERYLKLRSM